MLLNHFTPTELLTAAEAAEPFPPNHARAWAVNKSGQQCVEWPELKKLRGKQFL
jgi:hypothetical protein